MKRDLRNSFGVAIIVTMCMIIGFFVIFSAFRSDSQYKTDLCNEYCNCSVSNDCSYTFEYEEVRDCNCNR
jgi:hypothetical protein